ncbi:uncharacterized protein LOC117653720 isoform X2 [Thrips palmi]|uniref:Uncharacterized protein LOC117653720 isoform X2 n=1 Tax=Thrips palmi TaxID=161013 RepID=A0A6P9ADP1_THRPL|nr:uncharacterized protein LOC117653720 isoform X2 [Thrips palmi]
MPTERGPYTKDSRTTKWRRNLEEGSTCTDHGEDCDFHTLARSDMKLEDVDQYNEQDSNEEVNYDEEGDCHQGLDEGLEFIADQSLQCASEDLDEEKGSQSNQDMNEDEEMNSNDDSHHEISRHSGLSSDSSIPSEETIEKSVLNSSINVCARCADILSECVCESSSTDCSDIEICLLERLQRNEDSVYSDGHDEDSSPDPSTSGSSSGFDSSGSSNGNGGDDPPSGDSDPGPDEGGDELEDLDENNFSLQDASLNRIMQAAEGRTAREMLAMVLALSVRHNLNYVTLIAVCQIINAGCAFKLLPSTIKQLWSVLRKQNAGIVKQAYCPKCYSNLGEVRHLPRNVVCVNQLCDYRCRRRVVKYFITLSIKRQLKNLLTLPGMWQLLQYRYNRQKLFENAYEDVLDGHGYQALGDIGNGLTCQINVDGFSTSGSSGSQAFPILVRINELPPSLRQKFTLLGGIIISDGDPDMNMLFEKFVADMNDLSRDGIEWSPQEGNIIQTRLFPTCFCLDARARASLLNLNLYSGHSSCPFCVHPGVYLNGAMKFPVPGTEIMLVRRQRQQLYVVPETPLRTHQEIQQNMIQALQTGRTVNGFRGPSVLLNLEHVNLSNCCSPDDLHAIYLGVTKFLTNLIIEEAEDPDNLMRQIDARLRRIRTPTLISRKPRSIKKRGKYKGSEWKTWLLYLGVPCMVGLIPEDRLRLFSLLSEGVFLLSQDSVSDENIDESERLLEMFVTEVQEVYGVGRMRFNIHMILHLAMAVRLWGPLQLHSTFPYEGWNKKLRDHISSPNGAVDQIVLRFLLLSLAQRLPYEEGLDDETREFIRSMMSSLELDNPLQIGSSYFFGKHTMRNPTEDEVLLLNTAGVHADNNLRLVEYHQCRKARIWLHSSRYYEYYADDRDSKSDNMTVFTMNNQFCSIDSIVVLGEGENQIAGMFCHLLTIGDAPFDAAHIKYILNENERLFLVIDSVRKPAIRMVFDNMSYVTPMSNVGEID